MRGERRLTLIQGLRCSFHKSICLLVPRNRVALRFVSSGKEWIDMRKTGVVKRALPVLGSEDRIILMHWGLSEEPRLQNVARVDRHGNVLWKAELPGEAARDCFVSLEARLGGFLARTYTGKHASFDADGRISDSRPAILAT